MENLPTTLAGITVLAPAPEKAPSIPCNERDGNLHLCFKISFLLSCNEVWEPLAAFNSSTENQYYHIIDLLYQSKEQPYHKHLESRFYHCRQLK